MMFKKRFLFGAIFLLSVKANLGMSSEDISLVRSNFSQKLPDTFGYTLKIFVRDTYIAKAIVTVSRGGAYIEEELELPEMTFHKMNVDYKRLRAAWLKEVFSSSQVESAVWGKVKGLGGFWTISGLSRDGFLAGVEA